MADLWVRMALGVLAGRPRTAFADQLGDFLQLIVSSLRSGHSMLQALDSVVREAEEPTSVEFARIIDETRVGKPLTSPWSRPPPGCRVTTSTG